MKKGEIAKKSKKFIRSKMFLAIFLVLDLILLSILTFQIMQIVIWRTTATLNQKVKSEQLAHKNKVVVVISDMESSLRSLEDDLSVFKKKNALTLEQKEEIFEKLKTVEKDALQIEGEFWEYENDYSIQIYPGQDKNIDRYFDKTRLLTLKTSRFIRSMEEILFSHYSSPDNYELTKRALYDLRWQMEDIKNCP